MWNAGAARTGRRTSPGRALFETSKGDAYGLWEHANIADPDLFDEGLTRLGRKAAEIRGGGDQLAAALTPEVDAAVTRSIS